MKIGEAKQLYQSHLSTLSSYRQKLKKSLESVPENHPNFDRTEISSELSRISVEYERTKAGLEQICSQETLIQNAEASRQESEATAEAMEEMMKCLEIARRISNGDKVPASDEKKLMEYDYKLYISAKNMAMVNKNNKPKEYDSLWDEEETDEPASSPEEIAENTDINIAPPSAGETGAEAPSE